MDVRFFLILLIVATSIVLSNGLSANTGDSPVSYTCEAEQAYLSHLDKVLSRRRVQQDSSCLVSADHNELKEFLIVDVRSNPQFEASRIPGSVNLPVNNLIRSDALKSRKLLVVDAGFSRFEQSLICGLAKQEGFNGLRILEDGVAGWHASGKPVVGLDEHIKALHYIGPESLAKEAANGTVVVLLPESLTEKVRQLLPDALLQSYDPNSAVDSVLTKALAKIAQGNQKTVVLLGANEELRSRAEELRSVYVLDGTIQNLDAYLKKHSLIVAKNKAVPERFQCGG